MPKDATVQLLTEIRDLLKDNQEAMLHAKTSHHRSLVMKVIFDAAIILFVAFATYFYYHTLVSSLG